MKMNNKMSLDNIKSKIILRVKKFEKIEVDNEENQLKNIENFYDVFKKKDLINIRIYYAQNSREYTMPY